VEFLFTGETIMSVQEKLRRGILAAKEGKREEARQLLVEVVEADENQLQAWLWLSYVVDTSEDKEICLENVLALDPDNEYAQKGLAWLSTQKQKSLAETPSPDEISPPLQEAALLAGYPTQDEFDNEWLCPYCTALTTGEDTVCPGCQKPLILRERVRPERSVWLWRGFFLQLGFAFYILSFALGYFAFFTTIRDVPAALSYWPVYLGLSVDKPASMVETVLSIFPVWAFWVTVGVILYSLILMVLLYLRVPYTHLMYLLNSGITLLIGLMAILFVASGWVKVGGVVGVFLSLVQLLITLNLWKDFSFEETRLLLALPKEPKESSALFFVAREYGRQGMWGNAVVHLRRAVAKSPNNLSYRLALTVAYFNIQRLDLAEKSLQEAEKLDPNMAEVKRLREQLQGKQ
jgi:tetratricopeptide (TPR) repeat protein